jgi:hypothetical protein
MRIPENIKQEAFAIIQEYKNKKSIANHVMFLKTLNSLEKNHNVDLSRNMVNVKSKYHLMFSLSGAIHRFGTMSEP